MKNLLGMFLLLISLCEYSIAQNESDENGQNNPQCETRRVINETTGSVHVITTCIDSYPVNKETSESNQSIPNDIGKPFGQFDDLHAQVSMAHSTYWIKWLTFFGVLVGGIGLLLLGKTLRETRNASTYARQTLDVARDEFRCDPTIMNVGGLSIGGPFKLPFETETTALVANNGKTPAFECTYRVGIIESRVITQFSDAETIGNDGKIGGPKRERVQIPVILEAEDSHEIVLRLQGVDKYKLPFCIDNVVRLSRSMSNNGGVNFTGRSYPVANRPSYGEGVDTPDIAIEKAQKELKKS